VYLHLKVKRLQKEGCFGKYTQTRALPILSALYHIAKKGLYPLAVKTSKDLHPLPLIIKSAFEKADTLVVAVDRIISGHEASKQWVLTRDAGETIRRIPFISQNSSCDLSLGIQRYPNIKEHRNG